MRNKKFAIVGGGIGGLSLAIALQRKGFNVSVYENAPELKPLGAGLSLASNAVKALMEIGIGDEILQAGKIMKAFFIKDDKGRVIVTTDAERLRSKFGTVNNFVFHRADLHNALLSLLQPDTLHLGKGCIDFSQNSSGITLKFNDNTIAHADYLIACDGIHSVIRTKLLPDALPRFAGYTCWRAVIDANIAGITTDEITETWGQGGRFGIAPLSNNRIYWYACLNAKANDPIMRSFKIADLLIYFSHFHSPVSQILKQTANEQLIWSDIMDIKPLKKFSFGKIVLMGDAAHATTPNMGQGACMAIEDAAVLANCLEHYATPEEAFLQFEKKRLGRTTYIMNSSKRLGQIAHLENPFLTKIRNTLMKLTPPRVAESQIRNLTDVSFL